MKSNREDVAELLGCAQNGDEQAMSELITLHKGLVYTIIFRMVNDHDTSLDLTQDTFIKVFLNIRNVKSAKHFRAWICKIARNCVYDYFRKARRKPTISLETTKEPVGQSGLKATRRKIIIQEALARLHEQDRMLLTLAYYEGLSLVEVAEIMKISEKNIRVYLHRARIRLRRELKGYEKELLST